MFIYVIVQQVL